MQKLIRLRKKKPPESELEKKCRKYARNRGWLDFKFQTLSKKGDPDSLFIKDGRAIFIEFKATKTIKLRRLQEYKLKRIKEQGFEAYGNPSFEEFKSILKDEKDNTERK